MVENFCPSHVDEVPMKTAKVFLVCFPWYPNRGLWYFRGPPTCHVMQMQSLLNCFLLGFYMNKRIVLFSDFCDAPFTGGPRHPGVRPFYLA